MGIEVVWDDEAQTIMRHIYTDPWTAQDVIHTVNSSSEMLAKIDRSVYRIVDLIATNQVPLDILKAGRVVLRQKPPIKWWLMLWTRATSSWPPTTF